MPNRNNGFISSHDHNTNLIYYNKDGKPTAINTFESAGNLQRKDNKENT